MKTFWLLPNAPCAEMAPELWAPPRLTEIVDRLTGLVAENEKNARLFLKSIKSTRVLQTYPIRLLNEHSEPADIKELIKEIEKEGEWGLISDQGLPSLADPGENVVQTLIKHGYKIKAVGAGSSIIHALLVTGFPAERFTFHGYLPKDDPELSLSLKKLERDCQGGMTQIAIERPYENVKLIQTASKALKDTTTMAVVLDIGSDQEEVCIQTIANWKKSQDLSRFQKRPAVFLFS